MDLAGKVAVVTGAGAGLGRAEALELARAGASLVLNDLPGSADAAAAEIEELGAKCVVVEGDVGERSTADALVTTAVEQFGGLHVVVNNAGVLRDRYRLQAKVKAFSAEAKTSALIIGALPPAVMLIVFFTSPDYIALLWQDKIGNMMLIGSGIWMLFGILVMRKMINFDY